MFTYTWVLLENWTQLGTTCDSVSTRDYFYHKVESQLCITAFCMDAESRGDAGAYPSSYQLNPRTVHQSTTAYTHTHTHTHHLPAHSIQHLQSTSCISHVYIFDCNRIPLRHGQTSHSKQKRCSQSSSEFLYNETTLPSSIF